MVFGDLSPVITGSSVRRLFSQSMPSFKALISFHLKLVYLRAYPERQSESKLQKSRFSEEYELRRTKPDLVMNVNAGIDFLYSFYDGSFKDKV